MAVSARGIMALTEPAQTSIDTDTASSASEYLVAAIPRVYGYFYPRVGGDRALAEDLTQETLMAALRAAKVPDDEDYRIRWLFHIARNKLIDHFRKLHRERAALGNRRDLDDPADQPGLPDLDLESLPVREDVIATLAELNPRHRAAIVLKYLDGCDAATVAQAMFLSESATDSLLARARNAFRTIWIQRNGGTR